MSESGQIFVAKTQGSQFTLYAMMKVMGIPLTERQGKLQKYLERTYPPIIEQEEESE